MTVKIILITAFLALTAVLITLKALKIGSRGRGAVKMCASALFVGIGVYGCVLNGGQIHVLLAVGLFFAALGDLFLVFMDDSPKYFVAGVLSFACASTVLSVYAIIVYGWSFYTLIPFAAFTILNVVCQVKKAYSFGSNVVYLNIYSVCVSFCGSLGLVTAIAAGGVRAALFGVGCFMYMCSDVCLGIYLLKCRKTALDIVNTALYFPGMLLIALSLLF